jgi:hypothetical protein
MNERDFKTQLKEVLQKHGIERVNTFEHCDKLLLPRIQDASFHFYAKRS